MITKKYFTSEANKVSFFQDVMYGISKKKNNIRILIVVDEFDRPRDFRNGVRLEGGAKKDIEGAGEFIKDAEDVQFLFVGIADNIPELLRDHLSAARKMPGTIVQAPFLSGDEIREIFHRAERSSNGDLQISSDFKEAAVRYSGGLPWIAQHVGYEAVRLFEGKGELNLIDFDPALKKTISTYAHEADIADRIEYFSQTGRTDLEILDVIWNTEDGAEEHEIRRQLPQRFRQHFDQALKRLFDRKILTRKGSVLVFRDPLVRIFSKKFIDDAR